MADSSAGAGRGRFQDLPLRLQMLASFGLVVLVLIVVGVTIYMASRTQDAANSSLRQTHTAMEVSDQLLTSLVDMETGYRGFLVGGQEPLLETYTKGSQIYPRLLAELEQIRPKEAGQWQHVGALVQTWQQEIVLPGLAVKRAPVSDTTAVMLASNTVAGKQEFDAIRAAIADIDSREQSTLQDSLARADTANGQLKVVVIGGITFAAGVGALVAFFLAHSLAGTATAVSQAASDVAAGNLARRIGLKRGDEFGRAAAAFDVMTEQLESMVRQREGIAEERRREAQDEARERSILRAILDSMREPVYELEPEGRLARVNRATCEFVGRPEAELVGQKVRDVFHWTDESGRLLEEHEYAYHQSLDAAQRVAVDHIVYHAPDGSSIPVSISSTPILDSDGQVVAAVQVVRDVSRERATDELKDQIISLVSHELRTPLGHIKGFATSLLEPDVTWDEDTQRDFIEEIDREADRLSALVTDLLDMSKIEAGLEQSLSRTWVRPAKVVAAAIKSQSKRTADHVVVDEVAEDLPEMFVDEVQIERLVGNLVENAAKYSPPGGEIRVTGMAHDGELDIAVADQGPGIPAEHRERIFEKFYRVRTVGEARTPGTGLGLAICRGIAEAHGGRLWLESPAQGGSRFVVRLPRPQDATVPA